MEEATEPEQKELWELLQKQRRLGEMLMEKEIINEDELRTVLFIQRRESTPLGEIVVNLYHNDNDRNIRDLVEQTRREQVPEFDLTQYTLKTSHKEWLPYNYASFLDALVLDHLGDTFVVAMAYPYNTDSLTKIKEIIMEKKADKKTDEKTHENENLNVRLVWVERLSLRALMKQVYHVWDKFPGNMYLQLYLGNVLSKQDEAAFNRLAMMDSCEDIREIMETLEINLPPGFKIQNPIYREPQGI